ncbi:peptide/nickel transport system permease protein [Brevibacterium sanguinis]|uniref:Peptide/nickel transport system permease protein n=2 Tax=Brevibacterium TaxID=1696 RepID=A0A366IJN2_9MICO|nr:MULTISPECIES: ABC transporter permease [Brevibacterium]RBP64941.1 peptide/nickel transport system permease protein [Brevibacterium sanguinis]RBP71204.1 peptide/nickel transport system permease protein [Brevibacterium celere]
MRPVRPFVLLARWAAGLLVVMSGLFLLTEALPGDFADGVAGADRGRAELLRSQRGLDGPVLIRLAHWWASLLRGDLGTSLTDGQPVLPRVLDRLQTTLIVAVPAAVLAVLAAVLLALALAWWRGRPAGARLAVVTAVLAGLPEVVLVVGLVLLLSVGLRLVPAVSLPTPGMPAWSDPEILLLPILALALPATAWGARLLRGSADDLLAGDVVVSARRRGVPARIIVVSHVIPRWLPPIAQAAAFLTAGVLGGSVVVESLLAYPGLGQGLASAVAARDTPMVQAVSLVIVGVSLALLMLADLVRTEAGRR